MTRLVRPEPVPLAVASGELQAADDPAAVVRMDRGGGFGVELGELRVSLLGPRRVVQLLPALALAGLGSRRQREVGERGPQVEAGSAGDDRRPARGEDLVDRGVRERLILADRSLVVERPDPDEAARATGS